ncbi:MAG: prepilin-type N-terminal cleavage/methylation domain-containing protein [Firmicutes bacterium]|nr:prepilin-type N-terminal cleavage/methylation domain-containing protein [Bacillota bacterium]
MKLQNRVKLQAAVIRRLFHKDSQEDGFSLLETLVAIVVFALVITGVGSSLVMAHRINARSEVLMQEQLKVSRAVEGIMASGILASETDEELEAVVNGLKARFEAEDAYDVGISVDWGELDNGVDPVVETKAFYEVEIWSKKMSEDVRVHTYVRAVPKEASE